MSRRVVVSWWFADAIQLAFVSIMSGTDKRLFLLSERTLFSSTFRTYLESLGNNQQVVQLLALRCRRQ